MYNVIVNGIVIAFETEFSSWSDRVWPNLPRRLNHDIKVMIIHQWTSWIVSNGHQFCNTSASVNKIVHDIALCLSILQISEHPNIDTRLYTNYNCTKQSHAISDATCLCILFDLW